MVLRPSSLIKKNTYLGNPSLKKIGILQQLTAEQVDQFIKCSEDPVYFIENYVKVVTLDKGFVGINLYPFQKNAINEINNSRQVIVKAGRQTGKTTMIVGYILWYIIFNSDKTVAILANKAATAREILDRIKKAYESLPMWIQQGVRTWNKGDIELENNCRVLANSTASSAIRGFSISLLYLDEYAFVPPNIADEFFTSVYPTISSGKTSKILVSSTPNGMNHFYKMWTEAVEGRNGFKFIEANWRQVPGRDQAWADIQRSALGEQKYLQEMECEFMGSSGTLISGMALKALTFIKPIHDSSISGLCVYENPIPNHNYAITVDTSRGKGLDYSACIVVDVTSVPYKLVATYKDNDISPIVYPTILKRLGEYYNSAHILIEINDIGQQVSDILFDDYAYDNILSTVEKDKKIALSWGYGNKSVRGIRTTKSVKRLGCSMLKNIIESQKILIQDFEVITELSTFIAKNNSYEADEGCHDDLVMCLVLFSWMTNQELFSEITDTNIKQKLFEQQMKQIEDEMLPMPISGQEEQFDGFVEGGAVWRVVER
jgi:Terminase large subunit, T4likevirus-type, N-terminal/Terminase RNaseH-like domain